MSAPRAPLFWSPPESQTELHRCRFVGFSYSQIKCWALGVLSVGFSSALSRSDVTPPPSAIKRFSPSLVWKNWTGHAQSPDPSPHPTPPG